MAHNELRINEDISTENQRSNTAINELHAAIVREESSHESEDDEQPQRAEEVWHPVREIVFGLACKQSQSDEDSERDDEGLHDDARVEHESDCADEGDDHEPEIGLDPGAVGVAEEGDAAEDGGEEDLHGPIKCVRELS
ncbi:hypothetical protein EIK77_002532 [Talaromyces pinophilus]|nr:hypothetical protein EIK77_002532 [Talaromyces pinophilus]